MTLSAVVVAAIAVIAHAQATQGPDAASRSTTPRPSVSATTGSPHSSSATTRAAAPATSSHAADHRPAVTTSHGQWWGVDSTEAISARTLRNVKGWYRGARPQFWGRYLRGSFGVTRTELQFARAQHIYVFLIVGDRNCSQCAAGDECGNDRTAAQASDDARDAVRRATAFGLPAGVVLFKDIEQVAACRGEPTRDYLLGWYRSVHATAYRTAFYGNVNKQFYDFPVAYCAAARESADFAANVVLDMNQPEPRLGAPRGTTGPPNAPAFRPRSPSCAPKQRTVVWQYGESTDTGNLTDIDQAVPQTHGMLAPDGSVS